MILMQFHPTPVFTTDFLQFTVPLPLSPSWSNKAFLSQGCSHRNFYAFLVSFILIVGTWKQSGQQNMYSHGRQRLLHHEEFVVSLGCIGLSMWHEQIKQRYVQKFWWENLKESSYLQDWVQEGGIILECILQTQDGRAWTGFIWRRIETNGRLLQPKQWTVRFHNMWGVSWLAEGNH